jgi:peptidoglycan/xylan/chitin deacetylase (PgdA/CDA1 family)
VLKHLALPVLNQPLIARALAGVRRSRVAIFMLHRFRQSAGMARGGGHDPAALDRLLRSLRASGVNTVPLDTLVAGLVGIGPLPQGPAVAFTVDDCYVDLAEEALPVFMAHDCHVTGFVAPDVVDGTCWFWWDQVQFILRHAVARPITVDLAGTAVTLDWTDDASRQRAGDAFTERLKALPADALERVIQSLAAAANVALPVAAPSEYAVLSWDRLRAIEATGIARFGAHTLTHPVLARCDDARAAREIEGSVARLRAELRDPSQVFAYPVGRRVDFGPREEALVAAAGLLGAVTAISGRPALAEGNDTRWRIPRFSYDARRGATIRLLLL